MKFLSNGIQRARELASQHAKLADVAIESLFAILGQAEKEFRVEVEAIGRVRHKNLSVAWMLVYEYIDNGNLEQWLHGDVGLVSPLTWEIRMNIILGTAKGLAYLHEGLEPKVVHRDVKSSNILLDRQWNAKVSILDLLSSCFLKGVIYVAPEYACTGMLNEKSDIYSFGILIMEMISGRNPVDHFMDSLFREFKGQWFMACRNGIAFLFLIESATTFLETELIPFLFLHPGHLTTEIAHFQSAHPHDHRPGHWTSPHGRMSEDQRHLLDDHVEFMEQLMLPPRPPPRQK
ncbi:hypothetical protein Syun_023615 [Stephania yunnanensis]|uniref:non-specific serine/threonine protein kinase n=1 Tax=Stephania yunnanensis TaxID=152371 RepID=A0AAP0FPL8_9MAGN